MQQPQYLNPLAASEPIDQNEGGTANYQFSGTFDAPRPAKLGVVAQHIDLAFDLFVLIGCGQRVAFRDVVKLVKAVADSLWKPVDDQAGLSLPGRGDAPRARQDSRRFAPSDIAASFDTHCVDGSSAS
jgi:hypothetical protein